MNEQQCPWLVALNSNPDQMTRLIVFAYAGGAASVFRSWTTGLPGTELLAVQLPGREQRFKEPLVTRVEQFSRDLVDAIESLPEKPTVLYGHSVGAMLAFEMSRLLIARGHPPRRLIVGASHPPHVQSPLKESFHGLEDVTFLEKLKDLQDQQPNPIFESDELMKIYLPIIRSDIELGESFRRRIADQIHLPIIAIRGSEDRYLDSTLWQKWSELTTADTKFHTVAGGHFFAFKDDDFASFLSGQTGF